MTHSINDEPAGRVSVPAQPVDRPAPAAPVVSEGAARPAAEPGEASPGRALAPVGLILVITGGTASWSLLGPWPTAGLAVGGLVAVGAVVRWRQGARPALPAGRPPGWTWSAPSPRSAGRPRLSRPSMSPARPRSGRTPQGGQTGRSPASAVWRNFRAAGRPARAARPPVPARPRVPDPRPPRRRPKGKAPQVSPYGWAWWGRGAAAVTLTPLALILRGSTELVRALEPPEQPAPAPAATAPRPKKPKQKKPSTAPAPAAPVPRPGPAIPRPTAAASTTSSSSRSTTMSSGNIIAASEALRDYIGAFVPQTAADMTDFVADLHEVFTALDESLASVSARFSDEEPVHPVVVDHLGELRSMVSALVDVAADAGPIFKQAHEADLERLDNPRPNEQKMDHSQQ
ncbi:hypothetical protein OIE13_22185 [Streptosporangium sp. NBC_01810]|uniref:hypothetical protein n=1 Tax=Streptosporangium sp. NBC_01810 TaxID=2975951 RepID=UPI002DDB0BCE|nr:hypothetical protein [Streptosporangium sp. NBC_01810]WSA23652.1 hypothetical protein OIE13_22185 [Streptosporangium sp. NBC_01810]